MTSSITRSRILCAVLAFFAAAVAVGFGLTHPAQFFAVYLVAALIWLNPALGCILLGFIHRLTGGDWGETLAPYLAAGRRTVPWALLFFVPLLFGTHDLFPWAGGPASAAPPSPNTHPAYLSERWYVLRAVCYVAAILFLLWVSRRKPGTDWAGPVGMIVYIVTVYLISVDWIVTLEPGWASTGFPVIFMASQALSAFALCIGAAIWNPGAARGAGERDLPGVWKDLGNLLLAAVMFWAYVSYGQFLIVWSGNLPDDAHWYLHRNAGGWHYLLIALVLLNLLTPVVFLLSSRIKRRARALGMLATEVLLCQCAYLYWLVLPSFHTGGIVPVVLDVLLPAAAVGCALFFYLGSLESGVEPPLP